MQQSIDQRPRQWPGKQHLKLNQPEATAIGPSLQVNGFTLQYSSVSGWRSWAWRSSWIKRRD